MNFEEKTVSSNLVFDGKIMKVYTDEVLLPNGKRGYREWIYHRGAVAAVPIQDGKVFLVRQYRYAVKKELLEIPAGKLDSDDEDPEWRIKEELMEEIGMEPGNLEYLGYIYTSPGFASEKIHLYLATDLKPRKENPDEDEFLDVVIVDLDEVLKKCLNGEIVDSKTVAGVVRAYARLKGGIP